MIIFQASEVLSKSADIAQKDPHGFIITAVSILVVFSSLIILYFAYKFIGIVVNKTCSRSSRKSSSIDEETAAAISMALEQHLAANVHDKESYIITIKRK
jgi:Na+-transporting methylmalonyl-CoA/oxaloacetate decarboxylase gamma subunit